jgi:hypothetical protein
MWSILSIALGMAASRSFLPEDPEDRMFFAVLVLVVLAVPVFAFGIAASARWAFTPPRRGEGPAAKSESDEV